MSTINSKSLLAGLILTVGAAFAAPTAAQASSNFGIYIGNGQSGIHYSKGGNVGHYHGNHYHRHGARQNNRHRGFCGPRKALKKAWRMGLNRPHISRVKQRAIAVTGYRYGYPAKVVFRRASHNCAVLRVRGF
ncbi:MAG: hypothetical protein AAF870_04465 [Pseudomonadota bacterium]